VAVSSAWRPLLFKAASAISPASIEPPGCKGCRGGFVLLKQQLRVFRAVSARKARQKESKMPKLKTKSGAKKRFKITGTGKVKYQQSGKRHGMIKRTTKQIREHRGTAVLFKTDGDKVKKYWLPNG
jgi:large subunit ribosomal protein L35